MFLLCNCLCLVICGLFCVKVQTEIYWVWMRWSVCILLCVPTPVLLGQVCVCRWACVCLILCVWGDLAVLLLAGCERSPGSGLAGCWCFGLEERHLRPSHRSKAVTENYLTETQKQSINCLCFFKKLMMIISYHFWNRDKRYTFWCVCVCVRCHYALIEGVKTVGWDSVSIYCTYSCG